MKKDIISESLRTAEVTKKLRRVFNRWNYSEVFLPAIEPYDKKVRKGMKLARDNEFYLVKPDITSQIVKNLKEPEDLRLYYVSEVLDGLEGEWQAGFEYIGGNNRKMQVEALSVIVSSLESLGIDDFYVDVGNLKVWEKAVEEVSEYEEEIFEALEKRNFGTIEEMSIPEEKKEELWELFNFRGKESDHERLNELSKILNDGRIFIDLGTIRPFSYYEDIIFEVYSPKVGYPIGAGGAYEVNGKEAVGFAFKLEPLLELYQRTNGEKGEERRQVKGDLKESYRVAKQLVENGISVEVKL